MEIAKRSYNIRVASLPEDQNKSDSDAFLSITKGQLEIDNIDQNDISHCAREISLAQIRDLASKWLSSVRSISL